MRWLRFFAYVPVILNVVQLVERVITGSGEDKKEAATAITLEMLRLFNIPIREGTEAEIAQLIDAVVDILNIFGVLNGPNQAESRKSSVKKAVEKWKADREKAA